MRRRQNSALPACLRATACLLLSGCAQFSLGSRSEPTPEAEPVVLDVPAPWIAPAAAATTESDAEATARLVRLAEVWHAVRWFHPDVVSQAGVWDTAYLRHVDEARAATDDAAFAQVVNAMLGEVGDAETRVVGDTSAARRSGAAAGAVILTDDSLRVVRPVRFADATSWTPLRESLGDAFLQRVPRDAAVVDLRGAAGQASELAWTTRPLNSYELPLPAGTLDEPARRRVRRSAPDGPVFSGGTVAVVTGVDCCSTWSLTSGARHRAARVVAGTPSNAATREAATTAGTPDNAATGDTVMSRLVAAARDGHRPPSLVVVVDNETVVPSALLTLHAQGDVVFVSAGTGVVHSDAAAVHIPLLGGFHARVRTEELLLADGRRPAVRADTVLTQASSPTALLPDTTDRALALALSIARGSVRIAPTTSPSRLAVTALIPAFVRSDAVYPSHPERLLAVTQLWGAVRAFNPYLPMANESWDEMFERTLHAVETAPNARAYGEALFRFVAALDATQASIHMPEHPEFGRVPGVIPLRLALIDRRALVTQIDDSASTRSGVRVGDEVLAIGGEPIDKRFGRLRDLVSASNEWSREQRLVSWLETGPMRQRATFRVRSAGGTISEMEFAYAAPSAQQPPRLGVPQRRRVDSLANGVVRITLGMAVQRTPGTVATTAPLPAFVDDASAIIVDARGVSDELSLPWLSGSLLDGDAMAYARDDRSTLIAPPSVGLRTPEVDPAREFIRSERVSPPAVRGGFTGPVAVLVDANTAGEGELIALRVVNGGPRRVLVGSPTAGAVGRTTTLLLPGDARVSFPFTEVRHPDGRFIQRLGLSPNITAAPTVNGVRAGRDEVLEAATRWIAQQLAPPAPVRRR